MSENRHGERGSFAGYSEARLDDLLESVDVVLEFAREEFADFLVEAIDVGDQGQQAEEKREDEANTDHYLVLVFGSLLGRRTGAASGAVLSIRPSGR